ncbi:MAG: ribosome maturation factor RimM [Anaerolineales bacterium]
MIPSGANARKSRSGSPSTGEPDYLVVGRLRRPHGLRGELLMDIETEFPERLRPGAPVYLGPRHTKTVIGSARAVSGGMLVKLDDIDTRDAAGQHRNELVYVSAWDRPPLESGRFYHHQIVGCRVVDEQDHDIGRITEILQTGANDVYVVQGTAGGDELLLPAIDSVVLEIDPGSKLVRVRVPEVFDGTTTTPAGGGSGSISGRNGEQQDERA